MAPSKLPDVPSPKPALGLDEVERVVEEECFRPSRTTRVGVELEWLVMTSEARRCRPEDMHLGLESGDSLPGGSRISFEPGGQLELSSPPCSDVASVCDLLAEDNSSVETSLAKGHGHLVGLGLD